MTEHREGTSTGSDTVFSFAADNVERGAPDVDFIKRRPTYPWGDDPRGREIKYEDQIDNPSESYGSKNMVFRAFQGRAPLEGQSYTSPARRGKLQRISHLRPNLPPRTVDRAALDAAKVIERAALEDADFANIFPTVVINTPSPGASFSPGGQIEIRATVSAIRFITSATLIVDGNPVDRRSLDRRDQESTSSYQFIFLYNIPPDRAPGTLDITVRGFNIVTAARGMIADDAINDPPLAQDLDLAIGTLDGQTLGQSHGSQAYPPRLAETRMLRTPEGVANISVNIV